MLCTIDKSDFNKLIDIVGKTVRESVAESDKDAEFLINDITSSLRKWMDSSDGGYCYKYLSSNEIIGFILVKGFWNLSHLFVLPSHQRNGIGRDLIISALGVCREKSPHEKVVLNSSTNAAKFYGAMGFKQTGPGIERPGGCIPFEYSF